MFICMQLTWLLQPCLSADGNSLRLTQKCCLLVSNLHPVPSDVCIMVAAKALFFINVSSECKAAAQESLCSLRFGAKVRCFGR